MGIVSWLFGRPKEEPPPSVNLSRPGRFLLEVVGEASYQPSLATICGGKTE